MSPANRSTVAAVVWSLYLAAVTFGALALWPGQCKAAEQPGPVAAPVQPGDRCTLPTWIPDRQSYVPFAVTVMALQTMRGVSDPGAWVSIDRTAGDEWRQVAIRDLISCRRGTP